MRFENVTEPQMKQLAQKMAQALKGDEVLLLEGELGSGKTTFCRFLTEALGVTDVISPTYSLHNVYS